MLTAKLRRHWTGHRWDWQSAEPLSCKRLTCSDDSMLRETLVEILNESRDLSEQPGISFYLIDIAGQRDVFVTRVNHTLVDHLSSQLVFRELKQILDGDADSAVKPVTNLAEKYRKSFSLVQRVMSFLPRLPATLFPGSTADSVAPGTLRCDRQSKASPPQSVVVRQLTAEETTAALVRARKLSRMPSTSMAVLTSAIRVFSRFAKRKTSNDVFRVGLGSEAIQQSLDEFHPQNLSTVIRLSLKENELENPAHCVKRLNNQLRTSLKTRSELAFLELISEYRWCYPLVRLIAGRIALHTFSFFYAFFRVTEKDYEEFAGLPVKHLSFFGPAWHPLGMTLLVTHFRDHIELTLTYLPDHLSAQDAERYCDEVIRELTGQIETRSIPGRKAASAAA